MSSNPLVKRLLVLFGEPKTEEVPAYLAEYVNALRGVERPVLETAGDMIVRERKWRSWPTVGDILDVVDRAKGMHDAKRRVGVVLTPIENFDTWWRDLIDDVRGAETEADIERAIAVMEPYWQAKWIHHGGDKCRMKEIQRHAEIRRCILRGRPLPPTEEERATPVSRERIQALVDDMKRNMAGKFAKPTARPVLPGANRIAFNDMRQSTSNAGLHMTREGLTNVSRRMTGEKEDP